MVNEIPVSPTLTLMDLPCPSSAYNMSHGFAHGNTKGFVCVSSISLKIL